MVLQAGKVSDLASFLDILRYNEYKTDPYSNVRQWEEEEGRK